jgi:hypothetical protein
MLNTVVSVSVALYRFSFASAKINVIRGENNFPIIYSSIAKHVYCSVKQGLLYYKVQEIILYFFPTYCGWHNLELKNYERTEASTEDGRLISQAARAVLKTHLTTNH